MHKKKILQVESPDADDHNDAAIPVPGNEPNDQAANEAYEPVECNVQWKILSSDRYLMQPRILLCIFRYYLISWVGIFQINENFF